MAFTENTNNGSQNEHPRTFRPAISEKFAKALISYLILERMPVSSEDDHGYVEEK
jgi:hypothetical protein